MPHPRGGAPAFANVVTSYPRPNGLIYIDHILSTGMFAGGQQCQKSQAGDGPKRMQFLVSSCTLYEKQKHR